MSRSEALDAYGDPLLEGRTYRWLKSSEHLKEPIHSYTDKPDAAMIPSLLAQALQVRTGPFDDLFPPYISPCISPHASPLDLPVISPGTEDFSS